MPSPSARHTREEAVEQEDAQTPRMPLPKILDDRAELEPDREYAIIPVGDTFKGGFKAVSYRQMANACDRVARSLKKDLRSAEQSMTFAYVGPSDLRYAIYVLGAAKLGYNVLLPLRSNFSTLSNKKEGLSMETLQEASRWEPPGYFDDDDDCSMPDVPDDIDSEKVVEDTTIEEDTTLEQLEHNESKPQRDHNFQKPSEKSSKESDNHCFKKPRSNTGDFGSFARKCRAEGRKRLLASETHGLLREFLGLRKCDTIVAAEQMYDECCSLQNGMPSLMVVLAEPLEQLISTAQTEHYPYTKTFADIQNSPLYTFQVNRYRRTMPPFSLISKSSLAYSYTPKVAHTFCTSIYRRAPTYPSFRHVYDGMRSINTASGTMPLGMAMILHFPLEYGAVPILLPDYIVHSSAKITGTCMDFIHKSFDKIGLGVYTTLSLYQLTKHPMFLKRMKARGIKYVLHPGPLAPTLRNKFPTVNFFSYTDIRTDLCWTNCMAGDIERAVSTMKLIKEVLLFRGGMGSGCGPFMLVQVDTNTLRLELTKSVTEVLSASIIDIANKVEAGIGLQNAINVKHVLFTTPLKPFVRGTDQVVMREETLALYKEEVNKAFGTDWFD